MARQVSIGSQSFENLVTVQAGLRIYCADRAKMCI